MRDYGKEFVEIQKYTETLAHAIQAELRRLGLASTEADYGQGGRLDVDFTYSGNPGYVKIDDSQEQTVFAAQELLTRLQGLAEADVWDFWRVAQETIVDK
jgi:hypothetical protein